MSVQRLSLRALGRATLARQLLLDRADLSIAAAVSRVGGLQAQEPKPPHFGLWNRITNLQRADLPAAARRREVVRVSLQRGTLHVVNSSDYPTWRAALAPELAALPSSVALARGIDHAAVRMVAGDLLAGRPMRFGELRPLLAQRFPGDDERGLGLVARLAVPLVLIPDDSLWGWPADAAFGRADEWISMPEVALDDAREQLVLAHLAAFGPARAADVAAWSGLRGVQSVLDRLTPQLVEFTDESGRRLYDLPNAPRPDEDTYAPPRLLGEWDTVMLGLAEHDRVVDREVRARLATKNLRLRNSFMVDGRVVGAWTLERNMTITLTPYVPITKANLKAVAEEAERLVAWLAS